MYFEVRTATNPLGLISSVRSAVASIDKNVPLFGERSVTDQMSELLLQERLFAKLTTLFSLLAIRCIYLYPASHRMLSYTVLHRTREIGIRMALVAQSRNILKWSSGRPLY